MLRKIISIPEGVYYRGRFRATTAWSKVSGMGSEDNPAILDQERPHGTDDPDRMPRERAVSGRGKTRSLQVRPAGS